MLLPMLPGCLLPPNVSPLLCSTAASSADGTAQGASSLTARLHRTAVRPAAARPLRAPLRRPARTHLLTSAHLPTSAAPTRCQPHRSNITPQVPGPALRPAPATPQPAARQRVPQGSLQSPPADEQVFRGCGQIDIPSTAFYSQLQAGETFAFLGWIQLLITALRYADPRPSMRAPYAHDSST